MKKHYEIDSRDFTSLSVCHNEVTAVELEPGERIFVRRKPMEFQERVVCMVDRFDPRDMSCTMVRQVLPCQDDQWGQESIKPNRAARDWAKKQGFPTVTVPGGIHPLVCEGTVAAPDFNMSGTTWFMVPETALVAAGIDVTYHDMG